MTTNKETVKEKSEVLFLYESHFNTPNGDPFTGEQRQDDETGKALISDVRIKRYIRDTLQTNRHPVWVSADRADFAAGKGTDADRRYHKLKADYPGIKDQKELVLKCVDARLFGAVVTVKDEAGKKGKKGEKNEQATSEEATAADKAFNFTGPVQFALLNPSLNRVEARVHQNTSVFRSKEKNEQGAIGTTTVIPYALHQIHGWINPAVARETKATAEDVALMFRALYDGVNNANTRTKSNQDSLLLLQIVYADPNRKLYGLDRTISMVPKNGMSEEQVRSSDDYELDLAKFIEKVNSSKAVAKVRFYTEADQLNAVLSAQSKFEYMDITKTALTV